MNRVLRVRHRGQDGVTLIEMIVTIAIMTIAIVGIGGALAQTHHVAAIDQSQAELELAMRQLADYSRDSTSGTGLTYVQCASAYAVPAAPAGVSWSVSAVGLSTAGSRNGVSTAPLKHCGNNGACNSSNLCDWGVQELTLVVSKGTASLTRTVWKSVSW